MAAMTISPRVTEVLSTVKLFTTAERLLLAKLLLDSLVVDQTENEGDWLKMGLSTFEQDWDNPDDAIYDNWRDLYGVSTG
jgi:hypothetical protein